VLESPREVEVGRYYRVPCVSVSWCEQGLPVIGSPHVDPEINPLIPSHYHYDVRFMSEKLVAHLAWSGWDETAERKLLVQVILGAGHHPVRKLRKCRRQMPDFLWERAAYLPALERMFHLMRVNPERPVCPHRGLPLVGVPDQEGNVVCSGHGLCWNVRTGRMVPRSRGHAREVA